MSTRSHDGRRGDTSPPGSLAPSAQACTGGRRGGACATEASRRGRRRCPRPDQPARQARSRRPHGSTPPGRPRRTPTEPGRTPRRQGASWTPFATHLRYARNALEPCVAVAGRADILWGATPCRLKLKLESFHQSSHEPSLRRQEEHRNRRRCHHERSCLRSVTGEFPEFHGDPKELHRHSDPKCE